ncbi:MAG: peptidylprolyl isomerase [Actinobacteria bacterium]|nr:peptidylprolyl isomerase [Actinomycetota bacterium]
MTIDPQATYLATMKTSCGTIELKLLPKVAPVGVNSFVFLADQGFYDGLKFHRIVSGFVIQGGDPKGDGSGGPGYKFDVETNKHVKFDAPGILAYANGGPGTNGSQFFITLAPAPQLDPTPQQSFTIFGKVIHGKKIVAEIGKLPTSPGPGCATASESCVPATPVYIFSVKIVVQPAPSSSPSPSPSPSA